MALVDMLVHRLFLYLRGQGAARAAAAQRADGAGGEAEEVQGFCEQHEEDEEDEEDEEGGAILAVASIPPEQRERMLMMSAVVAAAIVLHNIPEGMATYVASYHSVSSGLPLAIAIAIHNVPEGLAVAMPLFYGTGSRVKAVGLGTLSGFAEPFGALLASLIANAESSQSVFGGMFKLTAGMMRYVCIEELLPAAYAEKGVPRSKLTAAFFAGCAVMASSLVLEKMVNTS